MKLYFHILVSVICLLASALAAPVNTTTTLGSGPNHDYFHSLQFVYGELRGERHWRMWQGPAGIAVNMCNGYGNGMFTLAKRFTDSRPLSLDRPAFPPNNKFVVQMKQGYDDCYYIKEDDRDAGQLQCDRNGKMVLAFPFERDPGYGEPTIDCGGEGKWHRGYFTDMY